MGEVIDLSNNVTNTVRDRRKAMYRFDDYNPYLHPKTELPLVWDNLNRFQAGNLDLKSFLRQTPCFPRWQEEHIRQARAVLVTNEPDLGDIHRLYGDLQDAERVEDVGERIHQAMLSWLSLSNHPRLEAIHGELPWREEGDWQVDAPMLAACGKAGYFLVPGEEVMLSNMKVLHLELSPFPQKSGLDLNPRNDRDQTYHRENVQTLQRFCELATDKEPRYIFFVGDRAQIRQQAGDAYWLEAVRTTGKDKSNKIADLLKVVQSRSHLVTVRLCRHLPQHGRRGDILEFVRLAAYELRLL
jgi:hypothetical protein